MFVSSFLARSRFCLLLWVSKVGLCDFYPVNRHCRSPLDSAKVSGQRGKYFVTKKKKRRKNRCGTRRAIWRFRGSFQVDNISNRYRMFVSFFGGHFSLGDFECIPRLIFLCHSYALPAGCVTSFGLLYNTYRPVEMTGLR